jgi:hypothetical protein
MREATTDRPQPPQLAGAFLALCDDGREAPDPTRRSALAALLMVVAIALATPLAWLSAPVAKPSSLPLATPASKAGFPAPGDDGPDL